MTTFDKRENAYENKYAQDQEAQFKVIARRNKLLGLWVADLMHLKGDEAEVYAKAVVEVDFTLPGDDDVVGKVLADLNKAGIARTDKDIREKMHELLQVAQKQILG